MNTQLKRQKDFWNKEVKNFDAIYSHGKSGFNNWLDQKFRWDMYARFAYTIKNSEPAEGKSFLDVGCGAGHYSLELASKGAKQVTGLDISEKMLAICRQRAEEKKLDKICTFVQTDLLEYKPDVKFNTAIGIGLFDYIPDALPVLKKMCEVVDEKVIISVPKLWTWRALVRKIRLAVKGCDVYFYSKEKIERLLTEAGFKNFSIEEVGQLYCITARV